MEFLISVLQTFQKYVWMISVDLQDVYFQLQFSQRPGKIFDLSSTEGFFPIQNALLWPFRQHLKLPLAPPINIRALFFLDNRLILSESEIQALKA